MQHHRSKIRGTSLTADIAIHKCGPFREIEETKYHGLKQQIHTQPQERQRHQAILEVIMRWKLAFLNRQHITNIVGNLVPHIHKLPKNFALSAPFSLA